ncbi:hypothetical protein DFP72DRAFT_496581 [Ephemerocybe angulata]|uniref:MYND-type domain-containing protein n=1 Tax=Ephemerocybe angulata TaxID=980116 RepID=A0A8H6HQH0_9AGAR|nr:hypothetical protein DFP72DRAFT_496581 [Tulosesus angulatus]
MSARSLFDIGQAAMGGVNWRRCLDYYVKAMKKILEDDNEDLVQTYFKIQPEGELETMPNELLAMSFRNITALFLKPTKFFTPVSSPEAYALIVSLSAPSNAIPWPRLANASTFRERLLRMSLQIHASMTLANIAWDAGDPATAMKNFTKALELSSEEKDLFSPKPSPGIELWISTGFRDMRDKVALLLNTDPNLRDIRDEEVKRSVESGDVDINKVHGLLGNPDGCNRCRAQDVKLLRCSRCRIVPYCGAVCQKADWKSHKLNCKPWD